MRAFLKDAPEAVAVFRKLLEVFNRQAVNKLRVSSEPIEIYRKQGSLKIIDEMQKNIDAIRGRYDNN
jgi:hypothetical protein